MIRIAMIRFVVWICNSLAPYKAATSITVCTPMLKKKKEKKYLFKTGNCFTWSHTFFNSLYPFERIFCWSGPPAGTGFGSRRNENCPNAHHQTPTRKNEICEPFPSVIPNKSAFKTNTKQINCNNTLPT